MDPATDVAVVGVDESAVLDVAQLALGGEVQVGQLAVAIGSPFNLEQTVTSGIISAVDRPFPTEEVTVGMLQTDAPINSGNSGGPLVDRQGRVIGINTAIFSTSGDNSGIGFAIPIDLAHSQAEKILAGEPLDTALLGVSGDATESGDAGVLVVEVQPGTAADEAGLEVGDVIRSVDGEQVADIGQLAADISQRDPGEEVEMVVERDGEQRTVRATLGSR
ncbi:MAG: trypsin-like peptidase domain-containing protein [Acidimicrobiia bacterium]|nr:trypsin-like peptidase domain-containing protein [Acidimicrobiia bacterium]